MKTSVILIILLICNTTALVAEPVSRFLEDIDTWVLMIVEALLVVAYYINQIIKSLRDSIQIDFNNINLFATLTQKKKGI